ncbi:MAG: DEAD/DEAH box helicase [Myxococcales bacterium]|nr:DEAD/DEAH box helicase [Myxococcales bacterium]
MTVASAGLHPDSGGPSARTAGAWPFVPHVRLFTERLVAAASLGAREEEVLAAVIELGFVYGSTRVGASAAWSPDAARVTRDFGAEARARQVLESFGPVELSVLDTHEAPLGCKAGYVVGIDADDAARCSFTASALPQLRKLGFSVELAPDYPWQVVASETAWYANVSATDPPPGDEKPDWFSLELGIELDGRKVNLLPALLDLIERGGGPDAFDTLVPCRGRPVAIPVDDNRFVLIPPERLRVLFKVLTDLYRFEGDGDAVKFTAMQAQALAELEGAFGGDHSPGELRWEGAQEVRDKGRAWSLRPRIDLEPPKGLQATLRSYQQEGLGWLQHIRNSDAGGILADDMGLGKTLQTIAHIAAEKEAGRLDLPAVVVTLTSLSGNWRREIEKFAPDLRVVVMHGPQRKSLRYLARRTDVVITTYPLLVRDADFYESTPFHMLILDEAQAIKNARSQAHQAVKTVNARHRLCLTGTPIENGLDELWAQFDFLMPGLLGSADWFKQKYVVPIEREGSRRRLEELRGQVSPFMLRRTKEQVATELPPKTEIVRPVELRGPQRDLYESIRLAAHAQVRQAISEKGFSASSFTILDALMKLRQVCCDPRLVPLESAQSVKNSAKFETLMELLEQQLPRGRRALVFSQFASMLNLIGQGLTQRDIRFVSLTGATPNRQKVVDAFEGRQVDVFLISLKAGGTGLNLTSADTVIHYDPWWNPAIQAQATDRAYRIGQTKPVFVYNLIAAGSVEERMLGLQRRKKALADGILGDTRAQGARLTLDDVNGLMAPLSDGDG